MSTWRRGSHLTEPVGPMSTRALYSGTVPRPGGSPRQRRPLRSLWAFAYLLGRLSSDLPRHGRWAGNHLFFLRGPATIAGHGTVPGLIGKKPAPVFPRIGTAYQTEAKRKRYHCAIERSCERRLIFFICLISEWFPYVLHCAIEPYRHKSNLAAPACQVGRTAAASTAHGGGSAAFSPAHGRCPQRTAAGLR